MSVNLLHRHPHEDNVSIAANLSVCAAVLPDHVSVAKGLPLGPTGHTSGLEVRYVSDLPTTPLTDLRLSLPGAGGD